ncbi:hypothetical protein DNTS_022212 [Danionella cerebrum]|uniref:TGF-beta propeptide domain-containing protein n=1 Tax=Danionella cerebrum TaxID=2873325 RepID=A0A553PMU5_9TELE|nr:hypothetical protein DNTS_022212 [Danionella translucida]
MDTRRYALLRETRGRNKFSCKVRASSPPNFLRAERLHEVHLDGGSLNCASLDASELQSNFIHRRLRTQEKREMQREILSILGLNHRPRPHASSGKYNSAPLFMLDLYNSMSSEEKSDVDHYRALFTTSRPALASLHDTEILHDADMVMSFVNLVNKELINGGSIRVQDSLVYVNFPPQGPRVAKPSNSAEHTITRVKHKFWNGK